MLLTNKQILERYGRYGEIENLVTIPVPYPLLLDWDLNQSVGKITCHKGIAERLQKTFSDILDAYGISKISELGINQYAGCYNNRPKRKLETKFTAAIERGDIETAIDCLSAHAWGVAIDLDPNRNLLHETAKTARFARPEYKTMIDIFYDNGFASYGREKNFDWMHFETVI